MSPIKQNIRILGGAVKRMIYFSFQFNLKLAIRLYKNDWEKFLAKDTQSQYEAYKQQHNIIEQYLLDNGYWSILNSTFKNAQQSTYPNKNTMPIWICWWQGKEQMPPLIKLCYKRICHLAGTHPVHLITLDNLTQYIKLPSKIMRKFQSGKIRHAHLADLVRLKLLAKYGGLWLDSTIYLTCPIDETIFGRPFYSIKNAPVDNFSVSEFRWCSFFMESLPGNPLIVAVEKALETYMLQQTSFIHYLLIDYFIDILYKKNSDIQRLIDDIEITNPDMHWLRQHLNIAFNKMDFNKIVQRTNIYKITYKGVLSKKTDDNEITYYGYLLEN